LKFNKDTVIIPSFFDYNFHSNRDSKLNQIVIH